MTGHIGTLGFNPSLYPNLAYDTLTSFDYVAALGLVPNLLVVHPYLPFKTVQDLIAYARANPNKLRKSARSCTCLKCWRGSRPRGSSCGR
jgi:tripartite-type tricarboxylate transporter receptor subunit TctC